MADEISERMPTNVKVGLGVAWGQAGLTLIAAIVVFGLAGNMSAHGQDGAGGLMFAAVVSIAMGAAVGVSAFFAAKRLMWALVVILVVEGISVLSSLFLLVTAAQPGVACGLVLPLLVAGQLLSPNGREWFFSR